MSGHYLSKLSSMLKRYSTLSSSKRGVHNILWNYASFMQVIRYTLNSLHVEMVCRSGFINLEINVISLTVKVQSAA